MNDFIYVIQDRVSRAFGEPFTGSCDEAVRRDMTIHFARIIKLGYPAGDAVCLRVGQVTSDRDNYIIEPILPAVVVCSGSDEAVANYVAAGFASEEDVEEDLP